MASNSNQNLQYEFLYEIARIDNRAHREELLEYYLCSIGFNINQGGSILQKILVFPDANHRAQLLNALRGVVRENTASTAPVPHNEAGPSATGNSPSTANNDSSTTSNGQMAPEGNNVVPVMTGEKTSVGEVQVDDNSTQRAEQLLQAQAYIRSVNPYSNQGGSILQKILYFHDANHRAQMLKALHGDVRENTASTAPVPHNEAGPSATANSPSTANNDSSTTSNGQMAPEGNNVVPVMTGEKTSVGECFSSEFLNQIARIDNRPQREEMLEALLRIAGFNSNQGGSILHKILDFPDANHRAQMLKALHGDVRENTASTAPVPHNEAGPSATGNSPSTANNDSSTTSNGQMAPEGNNVVPVMTGEKTSVGEVRIDNSTQREQWHQADLRSVGFNSNQGGSQVHEVSNLLYTNLRSPTLAAHHAAGVPHNEAGPSATANFPSTATNDSSTTSHGWMAPRERDARELASAASQALAGLLPWFPAINRSQVEVQETTGGQLGLLKCPICQIKIESKRTKQREKWSISEVTKHIQLCMLDKVIREKVSPQNKPSEIRSFFGLS